MNRTLPALLAVWLLAAPAAQAQFAFVTNHSTITITGYTGAGAVTIPDAINGLPVTSIGYQAFWANENLTSVTIPDTVTSVGDFAFGLCTGMTNVAMGNHIANIGADAFASTSLTSLSLPESLQVLGNSAFFNCNGLTSVTIPDSVVKLGQASFEACTSLTNATVGNSVTNIALEAFSGCTGLASVTIGNSVREIVGGAFKGCSNLTSITIPDSVLNIPVFYFALGEAGAFQNCASLTNVTIGSSVTNLGERSFYGCVSLRTVIIPASVTSIGAEAFAACRQLTGIKVDSMNSAYSSLDGVLFDKNETMLVRCPAGKVGNYPIPNTVTSIGFEAFEDCFNLNSIVIGANVTNFGFWPFELNADFSGFYSEGDAPTDFIGAFAPEYSGATNATIYYLPGLAGWSNSFAGLPTALWLPEMQTCDSNFSVRTNQFGFNINWARGQTVVVEACTDIANPVWQPVQTNTLANDSVYFSDAQWTKYPARFYRLRSP